VVRIHSPRPTFFFCPSTIWARRRPYVMVIAMPKHKNKIRVTAYKWYWRVSEGNGGLALLLEDNDPFEAELPVQTAEGLAGMARLLATFSQVYYDDVAKVLYTDLFTPGTAKN
jgi:hypothetical protein